MESSAQLPAVLEVDDSVRAEVNRTRPGRFAVRLTTERDGVPVTVLRGRITVALVQERYAEVAPCPAWLSELVVPAVRGPVPAPPREDGFEWPWRVRYFHCHFSDRVQHAAYVGALEETVDRFLAEAGISVPRLLAERGWIPVVSRVGVRLLADARMDDVVRTTFTVDDVIGGRAFTGRMDCFAPDSEGEGGEGDGGKRPVATASILHGYAISRGPGTGSLAQLDPPILRALGSRP